jgi:hypothetical protein
MGAIKVWTERASSRNNGPLTQSAVNQTRGKDMMVRREGSNEIPVLGCSYNWYSSLNAVVYIWSANLIVAMGLICGNLYLKSSGPKGHTFDYHGESFANWDGQWYKTIAEKGYFFNRNTHSSVAFFPAYPLTGYLISRLTGLRVEIALFIISNIALTAVAILLGHYFSLRFSASNNSEYAGDYAILAFALLPPTFFFRMVYSEALFLLVVMAVLYGIERRYPVLMIAALVGLGTAVRPVGIGLIPSLLIYAWHIYPKFTDLCKHMCLLLPLSVWGLLAYMLYLQINVHDAFSFIQTQSHWRDRTSPALPAKLVALVSLEPIGAVFSPSSPGFWQNNESSRFALFSLKFVNPLFFLGTIAFVGFGAIRRWLTSCETSAALCLLVIPYWTVGYGNYMLSMARYSCAAMPVYLVLGKLLSHMPPPLAATTLSISGILRVLLTM